VIVDSCSDFYAVCVVVGPTRKRADLLFAGLAEWTRGDGSYLQGVFLSPMESLTAYSSCACVANNIFPVALIFFGYMWVANDFFFPIA
jgi:hypothetical protein